jgi:hypothetical protein
VRPIFTTLESGAQALVNFSQAPRAGTVGHFGAHAQNRHPRRRSTDLLPDAHHLAA